MIAAGLLAGALLSGVAQAQDNTETVQDASVDIELFKPHADGHGYFSMPSAATLGHLQLGSGLWINLSNDPIVLELDGERVAPGAAADGDAGDALLDSRSIGHVQLGMGVSRYFSLSIDAPLILNQSGVDPDGLDDPTANPDALGVSGLGDISVQPKMVVIDRDRMPVGLAVMVPVGLPTGTGGNFFGEEAFTFTPMAVAEFSDGSIRSRSYKFRTSVMAGYHVRPESRIRDVRFANQVVYGLALGVHPTDVLELIGEFHGAVSGPQSAQQPAETLLGAKVLAGRWVTINAAAGTGVLPGVGAPDWRVVSGVTVAPSFDPNSRDQDKDGVVDGMDRCVREAEDLDGYQDEDGCPELDNDVDGLPDDQDQCPNDPEDDDGWLDNDGCPDSDNDKDGVLDVADRCPNEAENANGYMDEDGCPDEAPLTDTDGDGYNDDVDRCPYDAEDLDGFQDEDGCPDADNDNDGVADADDQCPDQREVFNGVDDDDGCPDEGRVVIDKESIKIMDKIYFDTGKATIQAKSGSLLDEIAAVIKGNPDLLKIRIEGHTDSVGSDITNLRLSQARADSVKAALSQRGVEAGRLDAAGFGEMRPIAGNDNEKGRAQNRRVEFIIVDRK